MSTSPAVATRDATAVATRDPAEVAAALRPLVSRLRRRLHTLAAVDGLTPSQVALVSRLATEGPRTAAELAASEGVRPQSIAATLAVVEERGLAARTPDPDDGRRLIVDLTPAGRALVASWRVANQEWLTRALTERYTAAEREVVADGIALLGRLLDD